MRSFGQGHFGHFRFRERGHCSLYINIKYLYIVADFDSLFSILTILTLTIMTAKMCQTDRRIDN